MWHVWEKEEVYEGFWYGDLAERDNVENLEVDGRIILKLIFKKWGGNAWTGLVWLRIETVAEGCECENKPCGSINCEEFVD
jgi:hypothetical protein